MKTKPVIQLRSSTTTAGRLMAGARSLWRANGMTEEQFGQPIIGIVNSFSELVPGHVHLGEIGRRVKSVIESLGCFAPEFNTMALDDGIAMGHGGMLYSLPSRELIADTVEYCVNGHCLDAMICISNCDKITPGMLMAAMRLNIPTIFVSGGPMEAGKGNIDLVTAMVAGADQKVSDERLSEIENSACPTCGSCSGMFTANSMNCLNEALGLALPGNGTILATHTDRLRLFDDAAQAIVKMTKKYYFEGDISVLPRSIASEASFKNAMRLDVAMGGSTNTVLHLLAIAHEAGVNFTMKDVDEISRTTPVLCKVAPSSSYHMEDVGRAGGVMAILEELADGLLINTSVGHVGRYSPATEIYQPENRYNLTDILAEYSVRLSSPPSIYFGAPGGKKSKIMGSQSERYTLLDLDRESGCIRDMAHAYSQDGGLAVLYGNLAEEGCIVKTAGVDKSMLRREGSAIIFDSQEDAIEGILGGKVQPGHAVVIRFEGPKGGPGMQEMLYPTSYLKAKDLDRTCFLVTDGRFSGGTSGPCFGHVSPEAASGGLIGLLKDGDVISYDIPNRIIWVKLTKNEIEERKTFVIRGGGFKELNLKPNRNRVVSAALRRYAAFVTSANTGAVQVVP